MDLVLFSLPEIILSDVEEPDGTQLASYSFPRDLQPVREPDIHEHTSAPISNLELGPYGSVPLEVESTLKYLNPPPAPDLDPIDLLSYRELLLGLLNVIQEQLADLLAADSDSVTPSLEEAAPEVSSRVEEPAPPGSRSDTSPNQAGQRTPPGNTSPREGCTIGSPVVPSQADASPSPLDHDGCLFKDHIASLQLFPKTSPAAGMASASEARDAGAKPEEAPTSLSNLGDTPSAQASQEGPLPGDPPAAESPSRPSVSGTDQDPRTAAVEDPTPGFRDDLAAGPAAPSVPALTPPRPLPPMREPENINSNSRPEATPESSKADSCDPPADVVLSDPGSSELRPGQRGETERKEATQKQKGEKESKRVGVVYEKQKRRSSGGSQLFTDQTPRPEIGERERRRIPKGEKQKLEVKDPDVSSGPGAGSALSIEVPQEEREFGEGPRMSGIARRTRSTTTEEREQPTPSPPAAKAGRRRRHSGVEIQGDGTLAGRQVQTDAPQKRPKTSGCERSSTPTGSSVKAKDGKALKAAGGREGTRRSCRKGRNPRFPTRLSMKLPTKYQDFILCKVKTSSRTLGKEERKTRRGRKH